MAGDATVEVSSIDVLIESIYDNAKVRFVPREDEAFQLAIMPHPKLGGGRGWVATIGSQQEGSVGTGDTPERALVRLYQQLIGVENVDG